VLKTPSSPNLPTKHSYTNNKNSKHEKHYGVFTIGTLQRQKQCKTYIIGEMLRKSTLKELDLGFFSWSLRREVQSVD
jgi:hypothetical protein